jgi:hypothetical protein
MDANFGGGLAISPPGMRSWLFGAAPPIALPPFVFHSRPLAAIRGSNEVFCRVWCFFAATTIEQKLIAES